MRELAGDGRRIFTSESVTEGHPDKVCDILSDSVLDALLREDPDARVACEVTASTGLIHVMGEITTTAHIDYDAVVREALVGIGYDGEESGFDGRHCGVMVSLHAQSPDIARGVDLAQDSKSLGAGDQGMMFGYACDETEAFMPLPIHYANALTKRLAAVRKQGILDYLKPDGKAQVSVRYGDHGPMAVETIVVAAQHRPEISPSRIRREMIAAVIEPVVPDILLGEDVRILVNATGRFVLGGPGADTGLTGRKIIVDTYGGYARHGGGAFSGKDPTKVDRTGSYVARYLAKNIVAAGLARKCEIQLAYAIGVAKPVSLYVDTFGTAQGHSDAAIAGRIAQGFDLRPQAIIERLGLRRPIYAQTASYGHFGRLDLELPWEAVDLGDLF
ncbi:MAG: methionine adenosyltransferase [Eubacterium aggregans]|uniref:S-adenosylmethionine synthase n=1 Tax=Eubacterium aggregans TaxID=81409 RepID=A0A1H3Z799_9FIRM|nr:methionine adenosyltransferase [Eubacterium aggregans]MEA5074003.1 methionine adenosyltransferase [Eubacterium aggregans]SEA19172.1 methionine adenosyltransferase [Eubacterium aggregans]